MTHEVHETIGRVRITTLGDVRCYQHDREVVDLPTQRVRCALLIYLAIEREAKRDAVQNIFWSDRDDEKGKAALKQTLYELRRVLGENCIESKGDRLKLADHVTTDLADLRHAIEAEEWNAALAVFQGRS
jgi:DNA-binding SARP family transcriptional activator